jgi:opacity protein-like surface antigen
MRTATLLGILCFSVVLPATSAAQPTQEPPSAVEPQPPSPAARRRQAQPWWRAYAFVDRTTPAAPETFDAIFEASRFWSSGGGVEVLRVWQGLFARVAYSSFTETGSRVAVFDDEVVSLGIPLTLELKPLEIGGGWRFRLPGRVTPYVGAAWLRVSYRETSEFAVDDEVGSETFDGRMAFGGVEVALTRWLVAGAELQYRSVPDALGGSGASAEFRETDLGGTTVRILVGIRH